MRVLELPVLELAIVLRDGRPAALPSPKPKRQSEPASLAAHGSAEADADPEDGWPSDEKPYLSAVA